LGQGDGTFKIGSIMPINSSFPFSFVVPPQIALADFNGDGKLDVVISNPTANAPLLLAGGAASISVLLGNGDGTFRETSDANVGVTDVSSLAVGDFNNDHIPDLLVNGAAATGFAVSVLLGNGNGTFQAPQILHLGAQIGSVAVGDFNRDGNLDIVTGNFSGTVSVLLGNGNGTFQAPLNFSSGVGDPAALAVSDFNRDGFPDLAVTNFFSNFSVGNSVAVLINSGTWDPPTTPLAAPAPAASASPAAMTAGLLTMWTGLAPVTNASGSGAASPSSPDSAPAPSDNWNSAVLFGANATAVDQLFASLAGENQTAFWSGTQPLDPDGWVGRATDPFLDPFKVG
jgi:hypothetical protein